MPSAMRWRSKARRSDKSSSASRVSSIWKFLESLADNPRRAPVAELVGPVVGLVDEAESQVLAGEFAQIDGDGAPAVAAGFFRDHLVGEAFAVASDDESPVAARVVGDVEDQRRF